MGAQPICRHVLYLPMLGCSWYWCGSVFAVFSVDSCITFAAALLSSKHPHPAPSHLMHLREGVCKASGGLYT